MNSISNTKFDIFCVNPWYPPPNLGSSFSESLPKLLSVIAEQHVVSKKAKKVVYVHTRAIGESLITIAPLLPVNTYLTCFLLLSTAVCKNGNNDVSMNPPIARTRTEIAGPRLL